VARRAQRPRHGLDPLRAPGAAAGPGQRQQRLACLSGAPDRGDGPCHFAVELAVDVTYSSTCPCSAALARQLIQEQFEADFAAGKPLDREAVLAWLGSEQGIRATPHSQRSVAEVKVRLLPSFQDFPIVALIEGRKSGG